MSEPIVLEKNLEGVFLTVSDDVHLSDVIEFLAKEAIAVSDTKPLEYLVEHPGEKVRISDPDEGEKALIRVDVPRDSLTAKVVIESPKGDYPWPSSKDILDVLETKNVIYGINNDAIDKLVSDKISDEWVVVAEGLPALDGKDAVVDYKVEIGDRKPLAHDDEGKINLKELSSVTLISKDQLLAVKEPMVEGADGISVYGKTIKSKKAKDVKMPVGEGTYLSDDGTELYSEIDGHLLARKGKLDVLAVYVVPGDVDYSVGNVHFNGSVEVKGAVRDGFEIKTTGNISVNGVIEGAVIETDHDLDVKIGITSGNKGHIKVGGNIAAGYIDKAHVFADGDIAVRDVVMHSDLSAGGQVAVGVSNGKGQLMGGTLMAGLGLNCVTLGSEMGTKTEIQVGVSPGLLNRKNELKEAIAENKGKVEQINSNLSFLKKIDKAGKLDNEKRSVMLKLTQGSFQIQSYLKQWQSELEEIETKIDRNKADAKVSVKNVCYPGVSISIRGITHVVREGLKYVTFIYEDGDIKYISYAP